MQVRGISPESRWTISAHHPKPSRPPDLTSSHNGRHAASSPDGHLHPQITPANQQYDFSAPLSGIQLRLGEHSTIDPPSYGVHLQEITRENDSSHSPSWTRKALSDRPTVRSYDYSHRPRPTTILANSRASHRKGFKKVLTRTELDRRTRSQPVRAPSKRIPGEAVNPPKRSRLQPGGLDPSQHGPHLYIQAPHVCSLQSSFLLQL